MSKPKLYPKTLKAPITKPQDAWLGREAKKRATSKNAVVREAIDAARKRPRVTA